MTPRMLATALALSAAFLLRAAAAEPPAPKAHAVWAEPETNTLGGPSPDGRLLSFVDAAGNLAVRDLESGKNRALTRKSADEAGQFAYFSAFSPDGRRIAYAWFNAEKFYDLRLIGLDGADASEPRVLYSNAESGFVQPVVFSPDGEQILTLLFRKDNVSQIALVSTADGSARILRSLNWVYPKRMDFSPDGRFLVYDATVRDDAPERDIYILAVDGSSQTTLTDHPANDLFPLWSPDGKHVVFGSDRDGSMDLWRIPVADGKPAGDASVVRRGLGRILPMDVVADGRLFYALRSGESDVYVAGFDVGTGRLAGPALGLKSQFAGGSHAPEWSPDGSRLAYLARLGTENYGQEYRVIVVRDMETGRENVLDPHISYVERLKWSPNGASLLLSGSDNKGRAGLFQLSLESGETAPLATERGASFRGFEGVWSADGTNVFYIHPLGPESSTIRSRDLESGEQKEIYRPREPLRIHLLSRSPNGEALTFSEVRGREDQTEALMLLKLGESRPRKLLHARYGGLAGVEWTPDGRHVLVSTQGKPGPALWSVTVADGDPRRLDARWKKPGEIRLSPDGKRVTFAAGETRSEVWVMEGVFGDE